MDQDLTNREKIILRYIVEDFIRTAVPVGSRYISKKADINLSPATIRNVMSDLEGLSFITHPHTSGGRIPTDKGYRYFVNALMDNDPLSSNEKAKIKKHADDALISSDEIYKEISNILGKLTKEISIVSQPNLSEGILEKVEIIDLSSTKILVIVSINSLLIKTLIFDIESVISRDKLESISRLLNEKLSGLSLKEIRDTFADRIGDLKNESTGVIKIFIDSINKIFQEEQEGVSLYIGGTIEILSQPEFVNTDKYRDLIQLTSDRNIVCHVLNSVPENVNGISILIGNENKDDKLKDYSIISSTYNTGDVTGKIAIIGPKRMNYSKMVSFLNYTSKIIAEKF